MPSPQGVSGLTHRKDSASMWSCETLAEGFGQVMGDATSDEVQQLLKRMKETCINSKCSNSCQLTFSTFAISQEEILVL